MWLRAYYRNIVILWDCTGNVLACWHVNYASYCRLVVRCIFVEVMHHDSTVLVRLVADKTKVGLIETTCIKLPSTREVSVIYIFVYM